MAKSPLVFVESEKNVPNIHEKRLRLPNQLSKRDIGSSMLRPQEAPPGLFEFYDHTDDPHSYSDNGRYYPSQDLHLTYQ